MKVAIGSDHAGLDLKNQIIEHFKDVEFDDVGTYTHDSCDYPDHISKVGLKIQNNETEVGIVICGSGIGASIVVNKIVSHFKQDPSAADIDQEGLDQWI